MRNCSIEGCPRERISKKYCSMHYRRNKKNGSPFIVKAKRYYGCLCKVKECTEKARTRGYCHTHYNRVKRHGNPFILIKQNHNRDPACTVEGCNSKHSGLGFCVKHYKRYKVHGDPLYEKIEIHGMSNTSEYHTWSCMKRRCYSEKVERYPYYGGRGITVCDRWLNSFLAFYEDMGAKPFPKAQIDRINNDGNYEPSNCRWVTAEMNSRNKSSTKINQGIATEVRRLCKNQIMTQKQLSRKYNISIQTVNKIINNKVWVGIDNG